MTLVDAVLIVHYRLASNAAKRKHLEGFTRRTKDNHPLVAMLCRLYFEDKQKWIELRTLVFERIKRKPDNGESDISTGESIQAE